MVEPGVARLTRSCATASRYVDPMVTIQTVALSVLAAAVSRHGDEWIRPDER
ncbi:MAG: hypothetical protein M3137_07460 [Actinomycetota bacterium]|nr:hypothetical protein [Actinomycetota bacterium]